MRTCAAVIVLLFLPPVGICMRVTVSDIDVEVDPGFGRLEAHRDDYGPA